MKKTITAVALLVGAVSGYSQGEINFSGNETGFKQVIYTANTLDTVTSVSYGGYTVQERQGSTAAAPETPTGSTVYSGSLITGTGYDAELLGAAGANDSLSSLLPLLNTSSGAAILNFFTGGAPAGTIQGITPVVVPNLPSGGSATIAIAAWNNEGGTVNSLAAAQAYAQANSVNIWGISPLANISTTVSPNQPAAMSTASDLNLSFSLGTATPEPSTIALGVMGVSAFLFRRRK